MGRNKDQSDGQGEIGNFLRDLRKSRSLSLRDVERITDGKVSNGYLSQLERGHIDQPSAVMLHRLASAYAVDYNEIVERAGFISESDVTASRMPTSILGELTADEEDKLLQYLSFIRSQNK